MKLKLINEAFSDNTQLKKNTKYLLPKGKRYSVKKSMGRFGISRDYRDAPEDLIVILSGKQPGVTTTFANVRRINKSGNIQVRVEDLEKHEA